jgi:hypothetical protein
MSISSSARPGAGRSCPKAVSSCGAARSNFGVVLVTRLAPGTAHIAQLAVNLQAARRGSAVCSWRRPAREPAAG